MRKRIIPPTLSTNSLNKSAWLNLDELVEVEITSEDDHYPIESALLPERPGWRAAHLGVQTIRLLFNVPQSIRRIKLRFVETQVERTQEFLLRWSSDGDETYHDIIRQQWNFSPQGATSEIEDLSVNLLGVGVLELKIIPDISGGNAFASLAQMQLA